MPTRSNPSIDAPDKNHLFRGAYFSRINLSLSYRLYVPIDYPRCPSRWRIRQEWRMLKEAINALPVRQRTALELTWLEGLSYREVGRRVGVAEATVDAHLQIALKRCAEHCRKAVTRGRQMSP